MFWRQAYYLFYQNPPGVSEWQTIPGQWPWMTAASALVSPFWPHTIVQPSTGLLEPLIKCMVCDRVVDSLTVLDLHYGSKVD